MITKENFTRINNDVNGNPRYVVHFTEVLTQQEKDNAPRGLNWVQNCYDFALKKMRQLGGKKFSNKQYGGGIVFQSYNIQDTVNRINELLK